MTPSADSDLSFLIQSPDNVGQNIAQVAPAIGGKIVSAAARQKALMDRVNRVSLNGRSLISSAPRVRLRQLQREFVLQADLVDRDSAGRIIPVLCHGEVPSDGCSEWPSRVAANLETFVATSGLTIDDGLSSAVQASAQTLIDAGRQSRLGGARRSITSTFLSVTRRSADSVPDRSHERRMIVVLAEGEREALRASTQGERLMRDTSVALVTSPVDERAIDASPILRRLERHGMLERGAVLLQSPFDPDRYFRAEAAAAELAATKLQITSDLCRRLGAETVELNEAVVESRSGSARYDATAQRGIVEAGSEGARADLQAFIKRVQLRDRFRGGAPDLASAERLLAQSGIEDPHLVELVKLRGEGNALLEREFYLSTYDEAARASRWVAMAEAGLGRFSAASESSANEIGTYELTLRVRFPGSN